MKKNTINILIFYFLKHNLQELIIPNNPSIPININELNGILRPLNQVDATSEPISDSLKKFHITFTINNQQIIIKSTQNI